jgi:hypothetical protein
MYDNFNMTVRAAHFDFLPFFGPTPEQAAVENITVGLRLIFTRFDIVPNSSLQLSDVGKITTQRFVDYTTYHFSYFSEQTYEASFFGSTFRTCAENRRNSLTRLVLTFTFCFDTYADASLKGTHYMITP